MDPLTASALIAGGASLINGIGNMFTASNTNNLNYEMFKEANRFTAQENQKNRTWQEQMNNFNNVWNSHEAQLSRDWQEKMIAQENEFNSPVNQLRRMQEAGINPVLLQMDGTIRSASPTGSPQASAGSAPSGASAGSVSPPHMQGVPFNLGNPILDALQARKLEAETQSIIDSNNRENQRQPYVIQTMKGDIDFTNAKTLFTNTQMREIESKMPLYQQELNNLKATYEGILLNNKITEKELDNWEKEFFARLNNIEADTSYKVRMSEKTKQEIRNLIETKRNLIKSGRLLDAQATAQEYQNTLDSVEVVYTLGNYDFLVNCMYERDTNEWNVYLQEEQLKSLSRLEQQRIFKELNDEDWNGAILRELREWTAAGGIASAGASGGATVSFNPVTKKPTLKKK